MITDGNDTPDVPHGSSTTDFDYMESIRVPTKRNEISQRGVINTKAIADAKRVRLGIFISYRNKMKGKEDNKWKNKKELDSRISKGEKKKE